MVGAQPGEDAAVVEMEGRYLVLASDPVTLSAQPGALSVQINANDVAVMGAQPRWLLASILLPPASTEDTARGIMSDLRRGCEVLGVSLIGGHTEVTPSVTQPIVAATMVGDVWPDRLVTSSGARPGDVLVLAGPVALEGTAILAREHAAALRQRGVPDAVIEEAASLLDQPGISVLPSASALTEVVVPHVMHDPTEGGLLAAVHEVAIASGVGVRLDLARVPILPGCRTICDALGLDPLALLASGSLLAAVVPADVDPALTALNDAAIEAARIGEMLPASEGMVMVRHGTDEPLPAPEQDELARWLQGSG